MIALALALVLLPQQQDPAAQLTAKLASPFLRAAAWELDWDAARARARAQKKLIFGYFTTAGY